jgi:hypothetical protein
MSVWFLGLRNDPLPAAQVIQHRTLRMNLGEETKGNDDILHNESSFRVFRVYCFSYFKIQKFCILPMHFKCRFARILASE